MVLYHQQYYLTVISRMIDFFVKAKHIVCKTPIGTYVRST